MERTLLERVLEASPIGIGIFDADGQIRRMNRRFAEYLGLGGDDPTTYVLGDVPLFDEDSKEIPYAERPAARVLATGESVDDQHIQVDSQDSQTRWLSANAEPLDDGVIVTTADITQLKEQAQRLKREHDDLEAAIDNFLEIKNVQLYSAVTSCSASPSRSQTAVSSVHGFRPRGDG